MRISVFVEDRTNDRLQQDINKTKYIHLIFLYIKTDCGIVITGNECIATVEQEGYTTHRLGLPALSQDIAIFDWYELENSDITNGIFYAKETDTATVSGAISELGMDVVLDRSAFVHAGYSFWLFGFVPAFLFVISVMSIHSPLPRKMY